MVWTQCGLLAAFLLLAKAPMASKAAYSSKPRASVLSRTQFGKSSNIAKLDAYTSRKWEVTTEHTESFLSGSLSFLCQFFLLLKCTLRTANDVTKVLAMWTVNRTYWVIFKQKSLIFMSILSLTEMYTEDSQWFPKGPYNLDRQWCNHGTHWVIFKRKSLIFMSILSLTEMYT